MHPPFHPYILPDRDVQIQVPCPTCADAIVEARLKQLVFGTVDETAGAASTLYAIPRDDRVDHHVSIVSGVEANRASVLLKYFAAARQNESGS